MTFFKVVLWVNGVTMRGKKSRSKRLQWPLKHYPMTQSISDSEEWFLRNRISLVTPREQIKQISLNVDENLPGADGAEVSPSVFSRLNGAEGQVLPLRRFQSRNMAQELTTTAVRDQLSLTTSRAHTAHRRASLAQTYCCCPFLWNTVAIIPNVWNYVLSKSNSFISIPQQNNLIIIWLENDKLAAC